ncbi:MAG: hypothetical protein SWH68_15645 [Thermodesulfobacteriota bacterium]|nr:hypothetical protein [Thermodesulfobacteriota bacterium]
MKKTTLIIWGLMTTALFLMPMAGFATDSPLPPPLEGVVKASPANWSTDQKVWKKGRVDEITRTSLIIDDLTYTLTPDTRFCTESGKKLTRMNFYKGTAVKIVLAPDRKTVETLIKIR